MPPERAALKQMALKTKSSDQVRDLLLNMQAIELANACISSHLEGDTVMAVMYAYCLTDYVKYMPPPPMD